MKLDHFFEDIAEATQKGHITFGEHLNGQHEYLGRNDDGSFSKLKISDSNSRPLPTEQRLLAEVVRKNSSLGNRWLTSGAGAGVSSAQLHTLGLIVDVIALTPLAPHHMPHRDLNLFNYARKGFVSDDMLLRHFSKVNDPYVHHQFIGQFPFPKPVLPKRAYSGADDCYGPLTGESSSEQIFEEVLDSLRDDGTLLINPMTGVGERLMRKISLREKRFSTVFGVPKNSAGGYATSALFVGKEHPIASAAEEVVQVQSMIEFLSEATGFCIDDLLREDATDERYGKVLTTESTPEAFKIRMWEDS